MDINTPLPTKAMDVETWLRTLAQGAHGYRDGEYPFLFGMATVKLAEAHAEIERLRLQRARRRVGGSR